VYATVVDVLGYEVDGYAAVVDEYADVLVQPHVGDAV